MLEQVGPRVNHVPLFRLPSYVPDDDLQVVLRVYKKILRITHPTYKDRLRLCIGTRVLLMEMLKEVPTIVYVAGHPVIYEYKDMRRAVPEESLKESPTSPESTAASTTPSSSNDTVLQSGRSAFWRMNGREAADVAELRGSTVETRPLQPFDATQWDNLQAIR
ncbi:hypothetical protein IscW_ISCW017448 [Ixodes scapularis]|uniref:Uncharacterized protein n=1 Tax=Ixodes scapularis TaxID=6945 RepID=B7PD17_IXOSC|nr:hypothetical protein IscW_ISCW017448 [Ixodes scapularis]|eukprot:XP_002410567.1 hypothetical protein IscW_ISCW017448 [Ixodes scapularis]